MNEWGGRGGGGGEASWVHLSGTSDMKIHIEIGSIGLKLTVMLIDIVEQFDCCQSAYKIFLIYSGF